MIFKTLSNKYLLISPLSSSIPSCRLLTCVCTALAADGYTVPSAPTLISLSSASPVVLPSGRVAMLSILELRVLTAVEILDSTGVDTGI